MKRIFWFSLVLAFLFANEYSSKFLLAVFVGKMGISEAVERTLQYASIQSYIFSASFRAIPFVALGLFAAKSSIWTTRIGKIGAWSMLLLITSFVLYGYWGMQYSLFTDERTSSTSALAVIWIPIWALLFAAIGWMTLLIVSNLSRRFKKGS